MTIKNREPFLNHLADTLGRARRTEGVERPTWSILPQWKVHEDLSQDELVQVLEKQCQAIHTDFKQTNRSDLNDVLRQTIEAYKGKSIVFPNDDRNETYGLTDFYGQIEVEGIELHMWDAALGKENLAFAERADIGITFSDITLAESGTVTLFNDKHHGRALSLLPESYIAIIPKSTLVARLTQATKHIHEAHHQGHPVSSCVSFISGPSNSADIESHLIVGVHGPIQVTYILVEDEI